MTEKSIIVLAVAVVLSSVLLTYGLISASQSIGQGLEKMQITGQVVGTSVATQPTSGPTATPTPEPTAKPVDMKALTAKYAAALGPEDAKITIVEFTDLQCPACRYAHNEMVSKLRKDYVETGKVRLVLRDFPLSFHPMAQKSAEAARCAGEQGKYWEMNDKVNAEEEKINPQGTATYTNDDLKKWAKEIGLDTAKFNACLDDGKYAQAVQDDLNAGIAAGVDATPTFFINGEKIAGAIPYDALKSGLDAMLAKA